jgi:2,5-diamino-6-(ribosylamino)-4(3H)-pyrimidinone 5'-phosphate reductase
MSQPLRESEASLDGLPFVYLNAAMSADGKLAPASRQYRPFGSHRDVAQLYSLRAGADAVMCGARTIDRQPVKLGTGGEKYRRLRIRQGLAAYPLRVIVSGSASVNPKAEIFKHRFSPIIVLTTRRAPQRRLRHLWRVADAVAGFGEEELDLAAALRWLHDRWKVRRLLCEGGGQLNGALLKAGLVSEVHVTICPLVIGGQAAPTLADGPGFATLAEALPLEIESARQVGSEMFLRLRVLGRREPPRL